VTTYRQLQQCHLIEICDASMQPRTGVSTRVSPERWVARWSSVDTKKEL